MKLEDHNPNYLIIGTVLLRGSISPGFSLIPEAYLRYVIGFTNSQFQVRRLRVESKA